MFCLFSLVFFKLGLIIIISTFHSFVHIQMTLIFILDHKGMRAKTLAHNMKFSIGQNRILCAVEHISVEFREQSIMLTYILRERTCTSVI